MILLVGIPSEPPLAMVHEALNRLNAPHRWLSQREFDRIELKLELNGSDCGGTITLPDETLSVSAISALYARPMDIQFLPELHGEPPDSARRQQCYQLNELLTRWMELFSGRVVNRPSAMASNCSKPYQAQLIQRFGFETPPTLITNDPDQVREFKKRHGRVVYKSISGARSIVTELQGETDPRLELIRSCPVQFQAKIEGPDLRVHTIGDSAFASRARTSAVDYRYAGRQGADMELEPFELTEDMRRRSVGLARGLGLNFAGIDLKLAPDGRVYCFEVNPCPAYSYYEQHTGQPIAQALAAFLAESN